MNLKNHSSAQSLSRYIGLSAVDDLGPFWQNHIFVEQRELDFEEIEGIRHEEIHPLFD